MSLKSDAADFLGAKIGNDMNLTTEDVNTIERLRLAASENGEVADRCASWRMPSRSTARANRTIAGNYAAMRYPQIAIAASAFDLARHRTLAPKIMRIRGSDAWNDIGALKSALLDMWREERNRLFKTVMQDIEKRRKKQ